MFKSAILRLFAVSLAVALGLAEPAPAYPQTADVDCNIRKEPNGLIRGDRVPAGCVLRSEYRAPQESLSDWPYPAVICNETIFYTPTVKKSVLANCVALSGGRLLIPTVPFSGVNEPRNFGSLGPLDRHFGSSRRHFGASQRRFGPSQRHFGSSQRHFGSSQLRVGPARPERLDR